MTDSTLSNQAYARIKEKIVNREYRDDPYTSENRLVKELGMSRTPIREALYQLQSEGMVKIIPRKGIFIQEPSLKETRDFYDLRLAIEMHTIKHLAGHLTAEHFAVLDSNMQEQEAAYAAEDYEHWLRLDEKFHRYFLEILGNQLFMDLADTIRQRVYFAPDSFRRKEHYGQSLQDHREFLHQFKTGDIAAAEKTLYDHIQRGKIKSISGA